MTLDNLKPGVLEVQLKGADDLVTKKVDVRPNERALVDQVFAVAPPPEPPPAPKLPPPAPTVAKAAPPALPPAPEKPMEPAAAPSKTEPKPSLKESLVDKASAMPMAKIEGTPGKAPADAKPDAHAPPVPGSKPVAGDAAVADAPPPTGTGPAPAGPDGKPQAPADPNAPPGAPALTGSGTGMPAGPDAGTAPGGLAPNTLSAVLTAPATPPPDGYWNIDGMFDYSAFKSYSEPGRRNVLYKAQAKLKEQGHYKSAVDGREGRGTQQAIADFQKTSGLVVSGRLDDPTLAALGLGGTPDNASFRASSSSQSSGGRSRTRQAAAEDDDRTWFRKQFVDPVVDRIKEKMKNR